MTVTRTKERSTRVEWRSINMVGLQTSSKTLCGIHEDRVTVHKWTQGRCGVDWGSEDRDHGQEEQLA